jgi:hypothetical protein
MKNLKNNNNNLSIAEINKIIRALKAEQEMINIIKTTYESLDFKTYIELIKNVINPYFAMGKYYEQKKKDENFIGYNDDKIYIDRERIYKIRKLIAEDEDEDEGKTIRADLIKLFEGKLKQATTEVAPTQVEPTEVEPTEVAPTEVAQTQVKPVEEVAQTGEEPTHVKPAVKQKEPIEHGPGDWMRRTEAESTERTIINDDDPATKWVRVRRGGGRKTRRKGRKTIKRKKNKKSKTVKRKKRFSRKRHQK